MSTASRSVPTGRVRASAHARVGAETRFTWSEFNKINVLGLGRGIALSGAMVLLSCLPVLLAFGVFWGTLAGLPARSNGRQVS